MNVQNVQRSYYFTQCKANASRDKIYSLHGFPKWEHRLRELKLYGNKRAARGTKRNEAKRRFYEGMSWLLVTREMLQFRYYQRNILSLRSNIFSAYITEPVFSLIQDIKEYMFLQPFRNSTSYLNGFPNFHMLFQKTGIVAYSSRGHYEVFVYVLLLTKSKNNCIRFTK